MRNKDIFIMNQREIRRLYVIKKLLAKELKQAEASEMLGLSERQIRRMIRRVEANGDGGVIHQSRGVASKQKIENSVKQNILRIYRKKYWDFGATLASEKLEEIERIRISKETLRKWLLDEGLKQKERKRKKHRQRRERKSCYGQMVQVDGSHHDWLENGTEQVLMGYIDDATNKVFARFYTYEGVIPAMESLQVYIRKNGKPQSV